MRKLSETGTLNTNSTANCLKHTVFNYEFIARCSAFSLHKSYSVSGSESETEMSVRLPSPLIFMWQLFCWQHKWLNAEENLSSSAVESLAMNSFQAAYFKYVTN